jgi:hypothetical protein
MNRATADMTRAPGSKVADREPAPAESTPDWELPNSRALAELAEPPQDPVDATRSRVESVTGYDLSGATIKEGSPIAASAGVDGLAVGSDIHLAPGVSAGETHGDNVLSHELAHVVQQGTGSTDGLDSGGRRGALEAAADAVASRAGSAGPSARPLAALPAPAQSAVQFYDPRYHRTSLVDGLKGTGFTADEVGAMYAANWERDLSQAHPGLGNVILAWKAIKVATSERRLKAEDIGRFQGACQSVAAAFASQGFDKFASATSSGGYRFYEHMDNPEDPKTTIAQAVKIAVGGQPTGDLPPHVFVSREYIKEQLFSAAGFSHPDLEGTKSAKVAAESRKSTGIIRQLSSVAFGPIPAPVEGAASLDPVAQESSIEMQREQGIRGGGGGLKLDPHAYGLLGRASHALEDFWSHSNFVELALGDADFQLAGKLTTARFLDDDKKAALAHKIRSAADEIEEETKLVDSLLHRTAGDPTPDEIVAGSRTPVRVDGQRGPSKPLVEQAMNEAESLGRSVVGFGLSALSGAGYGFIHGYEERRKEGGGVLTSLVAGELGAEGGAALGALVSLVGTRPGIGLLRMVAEGIEDHFRKKQGDAKDYGGHGLLAKDQPGHETDARGLLKTVKFELSHELSEAADRLVIGSMKGVFEAADGRAADRELRGIFLVIDLLMSKPGPGHPLWGIIEARRTKADAALNAVALQEFTKGLR